MKEPAIVLNWGAILVALTANFILGGLWYGPLFGKAWAREMGWAPEQKPEAKMVKRALVIQVFGLFLMTYVLAHDVQAWMPSTWGAGTDGPSYLYGFFGGFFIWLGFFVPGQMNKVAWEKRSWKLFAINAGHDFVVLQVASHILCAWR